MFAHYTQEKGGHDPAGINGIKDTWRQGFYYLNEIGCSNTAPACDYASCTEQYPCTPG